jgi:hypothetical protein
MSVGENVMLGRHRHLERGFWRCLARSPRIVRSERACREQAAAILRRVAHELGHGARLTKLTVLTLYQVSQQALRSVAYGAHQTPPVNGLAGTAGRLRTAQRPRVGSSAAASKRLPRSRGPAPERPKRSAEARDVTARRIQLESKGP